MLHCFGFFSCDHWERKTLFFQLSHSVCSCLGHEISWDLIYRVLNKANLDIWGNKIVSVVLYSEIAYVSQNILVITNWQGIQFQNGLYIKKIGFYSEEHTHTSNISKEKGIMIFFQVISSLWKWWWVSCLYTIVMEACIIR